MDRRGFLGLAASACAAPKTWASAGSRWERDFAKFVEDGLATAGAPGLGVAMVRDGRVRFTRGYGYAEVKSARRVTADTAFHIASVSKTVTGTAMMMLWQQGAYKLDDPVVRALDFPVVHPKFPDTPITFRHLMTHSSGISDAFYDEKDFSTADDPVLPLRDFLAGYLSPQGQWYHAEQCFSEAKPGTAWSYSNVAVALLGYMAGRVGPEGLDVLTQKRLFEPLGMHNTAWKYSAVRGKDVATPYDFRDGKYAEIPAVGYPDWPAGLLRTSAEDFAKFLAIFTNGGRSGATQYLLPETLDTMLTASPVSMDPNRPAVHQGLIWQVFDWKAPVWPAITAAIPAPPPPSLSTSPSTPAPWHSPTSARTPGSSRSRMRPSNASSNGPELHNCPIH